MPKLKIQVASKSDHSTLVELAKEFHREDGHPLKKSSPRAIRRLLAGSPLGNIYLLRLGQQVVGYFALCYTMSIEFGGVVVILDDLYLQAEYRGQGIGRRVLAAVEKLARQKKAVQIFLEVEYKNKLAQSFYRKSHYLIRRRHMLEKLL